MSADDAAVGCEWSSVCGAEGVHHLVRVRYRNAPAEFVAVCPWHLTPARLKGFTPAPPPARKGPPARSAAERRPG